MRSLRKFLFAAVFIGASTHVLAVGDGQTVLVPSKVYVTSGSSIPTVNVNYAGNGSQAGGLYTLTYPAGLTAVAGTVNGACNDVPASFGASPVTVSFNDPTAPFTDFPQGTQCFGAAAPTLFTFAGTAAVTSTALLVTVVGEELGTQSTSTLTICPKTSVASVAGSNVIEGQSATFTVNFAAVPVGCGGFAIPATLTTANKGATIASNTCGNIADGATSCTYTINTTDNTLSDGSLPATLKVTDSTATSVYASTNQSATIQITDNEGGLSVALNRNGAEGGNSARFDITCVQGVGGATPITVNLAWAAAATPPAGFTGILSAADVTGGLPSTVSVACSPAGITTTVDLPIIDDQLVESGEHIELTISTSAANYPIGGAGKAVATVADNDALPSVAITKSADCAEPATNCAFTVTVTSNTNPVQTGAISGISLTLGGTATPGTGNDYTIRLGSCAGAELATTKSTFTTNVLTVGANNVAVCVFDDLVAESTETVTLQVNTNANAIATTASAVVLNITDDDGPQTVSVTSAGSPAEQGSATGTFTLTRAGGSGPAQQAALTVNVTLGGNATFGTTCATGVDYTLAVVGPATASLATAPRTVTFPAGNPAVLTAAMTVTPCDDTVADAAETVTLTVAPTSASPATDYAPAAAPANVASLTIADNDIAVTVTPTGVTEGGTATFSVACTPAGATVTGLTFAVTGFDAGKASSPAGPALGTLTCGTPIVVSVPTTDDVVIGNSRSLSFTLTGPGTASTGGTVVLPTAAVVASVADNDQPVNVPTLGALGLGLMSLLIAGFAGFQRRRVQK